MDKINKEDLLLSAQRALFPNALEQIKFIFIDIEDSILLLSVYIDKALDANRKDIFYSLAGEICGDFVGLDDSRVVFIQYTLNSLEKETGLLLYPHSPPTI